MKRDSFEYYNHKYFFYLPIAFLQIDQEVFLLCLESSTFSMVSEGTTSRVIVFPVSG
jgi:hypothetical protein